MSRQTSESLTRSVMFTPNELEDLTEFLHIADRQLRESIMLANRRLPKNAYAPFFQAALRRSPKAPPAPLQSAQAAP